MKKILLTTLAVATISSSLQAAITVFTSKAAWEAAVNNTYQTEDFSDAVLNTGISFVSGLPGTVSGGLFNDRVVNGGAQTTWNFSSVINGWGGDFDLSPGGPGQGLQMTLELYAGGNLVVSSVIANTYTGQFWGLVSDDLFDAIVVKGDGLGGQAETYTMDNMVYATPVPEPSTYIAGALLALPFGLQALRQIRARKRS